MLHKIITPTLLAFLLMATALTSHSQNTEIPDLEKVYLHTDRNQYAIGESIWYKAYQVYAYSNTLFDNSKLLYVELVSPTSEIVMRNITQLDLGLGHGDFALADSAGIAPGTYQLRAYTSWMRNFDENMFFTKTLEIVDIREQAQQQDAPYTATDYDVSFFPEGGNLVENVASQVAFKANYTNGDPSTLSGVVKNSKGEEVATVTTLHNGMGSFVIAPEKGQQYTATLTDTQGQEKTFTLPEAAPTGYLLSAISHKGKNVITIKTNSATLTQYGGKPITLVGKTRGITYMEGSQPLTSTSHTFILPTDGFPEGIAHLTLYDGNMKPHSERLVFVEKPNNINLALKTDKTAYQPREKTTLTFTANQSDGQPVVGSFSMSVADTAATTGSTTNFTNICSYFLMESDIKGQVYQPGYYFDTNNKDRLVALDLLLLTQGWRDFLWKTTPQHPDTVLYPVEKEIKISGRLRKLLANSPLPNTSVNMILNHKGEMLMTETKTDEDGRFVFDGVMLKGSASMMLSTQNTKGKNKGHLILDSLYDSSPKATYTADTSSYSGSAFQKNQLKKHIAYQVPLGINDKLLDEIVVRGSKVSDENLPGGNSIYGRPDFSYEVTDKSPRFTSIFTLLQFSVPGLITSGNSISFAGKGTPVILLDGGQVDAEVLSSINPEDVSRIETLKNSAAGAIFGSQGGNGVLSIFTKTGTTNKRKIVFHSINKQIQGYYDARVFYSPNYDESAEQNEKKDIRNTLYWHPYIQPDNTGSATVSYFNSDVNTTVEVSVEGITDKGVPLCTQIRYTVDSASKVK